MRSFRSLSGDTGMLGWLWVTALVIVLDQLTKWMAEAYLEFAQPVAIFPHLNMTLAYNYGAAFSFLGDQGGWQRWFFAILAVAVCVVIVNWLRKLSKTRVAMAAALALVLGGAIGNLIDRVRIGKVVDFLDFYIGNSHWPAFNIADSAIFIGVAILLFDEFRKPK